MSVTASVNPRNTHQVDTSVYPWDTNAYKAICDFYHDSEGAVLRASRSGVSYMNHIIEGAYFLTEIMPAPDEFVEAFLVHPIFQDPDIPTEILQLYVDKFELSTDVVSAAFKYRIAANEFLPKDIYTGKLPPVVTEQGIKFMLIADKVQNLKDFLRYFDKESPRHNPLTRYFDTWLTTLGAFSMAYTHGLPRLRDKFE